METAVFQPLLDAGLARLGKFKNPEPRDIEKIFGPVFDTIALAAGNSKRVAASVLGVVANSPVEDIDAAKMRAAVAGLTFRSDDENAQIALQAEIDGLDDRSVILAQRSRLSLQKEAAQCWKRGTQSGALRAMHLEDELERRDAKAQGRPYEPRETTAPYYKPLPPGSR